MIFEAAGEIFEVFFLSLFGLFMYRTLVWEKIRSRKAIMEFLKIQQKNKSF